MRKKIIQMTPLLLALIILMGGSEVVAQETVYSKDVCIPERGLFNVKWDTTKSTLLTESMLTNQAILDGHIAYPDGTSEEQKALYDFTVTDKASACYIQGSTIKTCPENTEKDFYKGSLISGKMDKNNVFQYDNIIMDFDSATNSVIVKIKDIYRGKAKIRWVGGPGDNGIASTTVENGGNKVNTTYTMATSDMRFITETTAINGARYYVIRGVPLSRPDAGYISQLKLEVFINNSSSPCNNMYIRNATISVPSANDVKITNPAYNNLTSAYKCGEINTYINNLVKNGYYSTELGEATLISELKSSFAPYCFTNKTITHQELQSLSTTIEESYRTIQELLPVRSGSIAISRDEVTGLTCQTSTQSSHADSERVVASYSGQYWAASCVEKYVVDYDHAKLVRAGRGFTYEAKVTAVRTCSMKQLSRPTKKAQCVTSCHTSCDWPDGSEKNHAGPNDGFDSCIKECDGGNYTQECINSCYSSIYGDVKKRDFSKLDSLLEKSKDFLKDSYSIERTGNTLPGIPDNWVPVSDYKDGTDIRDWYSPTTGTVMEIADGCASSGVNCSDHCSTGPSGCSWNPEAEYQSDLSAAESEFNKAMSLVRDTPINTGSYTIRIADSYLNDNGNAFEYKVSNVVSNTSDSGDSTSNCTTVPLGNSGGASVTFCGTRNRTKSVNVGLPLGYTSRKYGNAAYDVGSKYQSFQPLTKDTNLRDITFNADDYYAGEHRYYSNLLSPNTNVIVSDTSVSLVQAADYFKQNAKNATISVQISGFGTNGTYSKKLNCYYGVYNEMYSGTGNNDPDCVGPDCCVGPNCPGNGGNDPTCTGPNCPGSGDGILLDTSGLTFIYRTIDLYDVFPNDRSGRWNWIRGAEQNRYLQYEIDPVSLTKEIESKGDNVYFDANELDYEFILTPKQIMNIRNYNKNTIPRDLGDLNGDGETNYLDYDLDCSKKTKEGRQICTSKFLDNDNYVSYGSGYSASSRKSIAGCNNSLGGKCVEY